MTDEKGYFIHEECLDRLLSQIAELTDIKTSPGSDTSRMDKNSAIRKTKCSPLFT